MPRADFSPATIHVTVARGDHLDIEVPLVTADGEDVDLTLYTPSAEITGDDTGIVRAFTVTKTVSSVRLQLAPADVESLDDMNTYDLQLATGDGAEVRTVFAGKLRVTPDVSG